MSSVPGSRPAPVGSCRGPSGAGRSKSLLWERSTAASARDLPDREAVLRALSLPEYRERRARRGRAWPSGTPRSTRRCTRCPRADGFDFRPGVGRARSARDRIEAVAAAASLFDATLLAGTARRYLEEPERCAFVGLRETGYVVLPADAFVRRVALREPARAPGHAALFPRASLESRLAPHATVRPSALLDMPGQAQRVEAVFERNRGTSSTTSTRCCGGSTAGISPDPSFPPTGSHEIVVRLDGVATTMRRWRFRLVRSSPQDALVPLRAAGGVAAPRPAARRQDLPVPRGARDVRRREEADRGHSLFLQIKRDSSPFSSHGNR